MALNIKILFPRDHPSVTIIDDGPRELSASAGELDTAKENLQKDHLLESEEDSIYRKNKDKCLPKRINIVE